MDQALLADLLVVLHLGYALFVVVGLVLIWAGRFLSWDWVRWPAFRIPHLVCTVIVPLEALAGLLCPLTDWENRLRLAAGQPTEEIGFIARLVRDILFWEAPAWIFTLVYVAFGMLVLATFFAVPLRWRQPAS